VVGAETRPGIRQICVLYAESGDGEIVMACEYTARQKSGGREGSSGARPKSSQNMLSNRLEASSHNGAI